MRLYHGEAGNARYRRTSGMAPVVWKPSGSRHKHGGPAKRELFKNAQAVLAKLSDKPIRSCVVRDECGLSQSQVGDCLMKLSERELARKTAEGWIRMEG